MAASALWDSEDLVDALQVAVPQGIAAHGVSIDSRTLRPGDLFIAIKGERQDGHLFLTQALEQGAAAAIVEQTAMVPAGLPVIQVHDSLVALRLLAQAARRRSGARFVAITGSVGKTGTKEALARALAALGATHASEGNLNNHIGVPLSLARLPKDSAYAVFELAMSHAGEIDPLSRLVQPEVAIITAIAAAHLENFDDISGIARAKAEIFHGLQVNGTAIINADTPYAGMLETLAQGAGAGRIWRFGRHTQAEARLIARSPGQVTQQARLQLFGREMTLALGTQGEHWTFNALAVLLACSALDVDATAVAHALKDLTPGAGRGAREAIALAPDRSPLILIDESYNASPAAVRAALGVLGETPVGEAGAGRPGRRLAVLGDMRELGPDGPGLHAGLAEAVMKADVAQVFCAGALMGHLLEALPEDRRGGHTEDAAGLVPLVTAAAGPGDVVMVKGSLSMGMKTIVDALRRLDRRPAPVDTVQRDTGTADHPPATPSGRG